MNIYDIIMMISSILLIVGLCEKCKLPETHVGIDEAAESRDYTAIGHVRKGEFVVLADRDHVTGYDFERGIAPIWEPATDEQRAEHLRRTFFEPLRRDWGIASRNNLSDEELQKQIDVWRAHNPELLVKPLWATKRKVEALRRNRHTGAAYDNWIDKGKQDIPELLFVLMKWDWKKTNVGAYLQLRSYHNEA